MAARRTGVALAGLAAAVLAAGCGTAITGSPQAATTLPVSTSTTSTTSTTSSTPTSPPSSTSSSTGVSSGSGPSSSASTSSASTTSSIRPMPPLDTTKVTSSDRAPSTEASGTDPDDGTIAGVDLDAVLSDLEATHVAGVDSKADLDTLADLTDRARSKGLDLWVVSIGRTTPSRDTSAIADALFDATGGTLMVLSPSLVSVRTDQLTDAVRDDAIDAATKAKGDEQAVSDFIDTALADVDHVTTSNAPPTSKTASTTKVGTVGGIDVDGVLAALGPDHIAISKGVSQVKAKELNPAVTKAWNHDLELYVAILGKDATGHLYDVASAVMSRTGGTVIMVSPSLYAISSREVTNKQLDEALDAGAKATTYVDLVTAMVNSLLK